MPKTDSIAELITFLFLITLMLALVCLALYGFGKWACSMFATRPTPPYDPDVIDDAAVALAEAYSSCSDATDASMQQLKSTIESMPPCANTPHDASNPFYHLYAKEVAMDNALLNGSAVAQSVDMVYLACPYSHEDPKVREHRFDVASQIAGELMAEGHLIYSPVTHTHPIAVRGGLPTPWAFWERQDRAMLSLCSRMIVVRLDGWAESVGVQQEIAIMKGLGKPISLAKPLRQLSTGKWICRILDEGDLDHEKLVNKYHDDHVIAGMGDSGNHDAHGLNPVL